MQVARGGQKPTLGATKGLPMLLKHQCLTDWDGCVLWQRAGGNPRILMPAYVNSPEHNSCRNAEHGGRGEGVCSSS
jgi:hypothetical protein